MLDIFSKEGLIAFLITLPALLIAISIHEFAHAYIAYKLGDRSQKAQGRLTLNPFKHMDWFGFISLALFHIGWGRPVMVDDRNFKNRARDNMFVALAGPVSNFITALVFTLLLKILMMCNVFTAASIVSNQMISIIFTMLTSIIEINVLLGVFNMIPVPPFDGSKVLFYFLPSSCKKFMYFMERYSFIIIIVLLVTGLASLIIFPLQNGILWLLNLILAL